MRTPLGTARDVSTWSRSPVCRARVRSSRRRIREVRLREMLKMWRTFVARACGAALVVAVSLTAATGQQSLVEAVKAGDMAAARALLAKKADVNAPAADGSTALHWAVEHDDLDVAGALLVAGARVRV